MLGVIVLILICVFVVLWSCLIVSARADEEFYQILKDADEKEVTDNDY